MKFVKNKHKVSISFHSMYEMYKWKLCEIDEKYDIFYDKR